MTLSEFSHFPTYKRAVGMGEELAKKGHDVYIAAQDCDENRKRISLEAPHCQAVWIGKGVLAEVFGKMAAVWRIRPDVVYSCSYSPRNLAFMRIFLPLKLCMVIEFCELYSSYSKCSWAWKIRETIACLENNRILCASRVLENHFCNAIRRLRVNRKVCYSPYAYPNYLTETNDEKAREKESPTVVFMASLWRGYGAYDVPEACIKLLGKHPDLQLEVLGSGPEKNNVLEMIHKRGLDANVHIRGYVAEEDLDLYFSRASVFVAPLHDSFQDRARCPSKVFYYIPYNKPIVTCKVGDPYETLGDFGFYYKPQDVLDMSRAIDEALAASKTFSYPNGFVQKHSWSARAVAFESWLNL